MDKNIRKWGLVATGLGIAAVIAEAVFFEQYFFKIEKFDIGNKESSKKVRILFLTDLHFKANIHPAHLRLAHKINEINPDLILISGDVIDETGKSTNSATQFFNIVNSSIPKVAILGNHDHKNKVSLDSYLKMYEDANCALLFNETKILTIRGERIAVTGVDDFIEGVPSFKAAVKEIGYEKNHFLLVHSPLQQKKIRKQIRKINADRSESQQLNISYTLAGHNHGGQVTVFGFAPYLPKKAGKYVNGWYNKKPPFLYLSNGFGTSTIPFRFGARSEITLFNLGV